MKKALLMFCVLIIASALMSGCSSAPDESSAEKPQPAAQVDNTPAPVTTSSAVVASAPPASAPAATGPQPKLFVPVRKIDFGKQRAGKSIVRTIAIKNMGKADLKIESVVPS
ncbi:MAG: hypothetical protein AB1631_00570 [Acidobacteriota bacterium]